MPRDLRNFVEDGLTKKLRTQVEERFRSAGARKALPADDEVASDDDEEPSDGPVAEGSRVTLLQGPAPPDLSPDSFFARLIGVALERMPIAVLPTCARIVPVRRPLSLTRHSDCAA